jgi:quercetin dioxygenase-like cupin family protein
MRHTLAAVALLSFATPAFSQDPVKVDPKHHKVEIDNAQVRVLRITLAPGEKTPAHDHPAAMAIFLTDAQNRISPVGGTVNEQPRKRGEVQAVTASKHIVENIGKTPAEIILVEFKNPAMKAWKGVARDATKVDAKHYTVVAENDHARALRIRYGPNEKSVMHDHPANVAVFLSSGKVKMNLPDGKSAEVAAERNAVQYGEAESHLPEMTSAGAEALLVELKTAGGK